MAFIITTELSISCSHQLFLPYESKCNGLHGHNYKIEITLRSGRLNDDGMVFDFAVLKDHIKSTFDHKHLNDIFEPTTSEKFSEVLACHINDLLESAQEYVEVVKVTVHETDSTRSTFVP